MAGEVRKSPPESVAGRPTSGELSVIFRIAMFFPIILIYAGWIFSIYERPAASRMRPKGRIVKKLEGGRTLNEPRLTLRYPCPIGSAASAASSSSPAAIARRATPPHRRPALHPEPGQHEIAHEPSEGRPAAQRPAGRPGQRSLSAVPYQRREQEAGAGTQTKIPRADRRGEEREQAGRDDFRSEMPRKALAANPRPAQLPVPDRAQAPAPIGCANGRSTR